MHATNTSSTRSAELWSTRLTPSKTFDRLLVATTTLAAWALLTAPLPLATRLALLAVTVTAALLILLQQRQLADLSLHDDQYWHICYRQAAFPLLQPRHKRPGWHISGTLTAGCYQSTLLVVLALLDDNGKRHHIALWHDALKPDDFSYLHIRLALERQTGNKSAAKSG